VASQILPQTSHAHLALRPLTPGKGQLDGVTFVVDANIQDRYKETIRSICETLRHADDFAKDQDVK
jgi:hypothetical protein